MSEGQSAVDFHGLGFIDLAPVPLESLAGFAEDDLADAWASFRLSCERIVGGDPDLRPGVAYSAAHRAACAEALALGAPDKAAISAFLKARFRAFRIRPSDGATRGFLTGYYEPVIPGARGRDARYSEPLLARPDDLVTFRPGETPAGFDPRFSAARRLPDGQLAPYFTRADIERAGTGAPVAFVRDPIEAFMIQVQGSAAIRLDGGELIRITYAGRNGRPYTSIGRILVERGDIAAGDMSLARLKQWVRDQGQRPGEPGRELLWRNESYVFFQVDDTAARRIGPIGAAGAPLRPLRSIAIDRAIWPYGLFFWIEAHMPWRTRAPSAFRRLMVGQDTGTAIVGAARADIYIGSGDDCGAIAGDIRHPADMVVLLPAADVAP